MPRKQNPYKNLNGKELLLTASLNILNQYGYGGLSLSSIAKEAGVNRQLVYHHFKNTDDALMELAHRWDESGIQITLEALANTNEVSAKKIIGIAKGMFDWLRAYPEICKLQLVLLQTAPLFPELKRLMDDAIVVGRNRIKSFLMLEKKYKTASSQKIEPIVDNIHSYLYGFLFYTIIMNQWEQIDRLEENCIKGLRQMIDGYLQ